MEGQTIQRPKRNRGLINLLGCLAILGSCTLLTAVIAIVSLFVFRDRVTGIGLQAAGFENEGRTEAIFEEAAAAATAQPIAAPQIVDAVTPQSYTFTAPGVQQTFNNAPEIELSVGEDEIGNDLATVVTGEAELMRLCRELTVACSAQGGTTNGVGVRNASVDLKPGGAVIRGEFNAGSLGWQQAGLVLQVEGTQLRVRGVDVGGVLYSNPPADLAALVAEAERELNDGLAQLALSTEGQQYSIEQINIDETTLTVVLR